MKKIIVVGHSSAEKRQLDLFMTRPFKDIKIIIATPDKWGNINFQKKHISKNLGVCPLKVFYRNNISRYFLIGLKDLIKHERPDIIYCQAEPWSLQAFQCAKICKYYKIPLMLYSFENLITVYKRRDRKYFKLLKLVELFVYKNSRLIIAGSKKAKMILRSRGFNGRVAILPISGVNDNLFFKKRNHNKGTNILYLGRLVQEKGIKDILNAALIVRKRLPHAIFNFVGAGELFSEIINFSKNNNLEQNIKLPGQVPYKDVPKIMQSSDLFIYPSRKTEYWEEQFGFSIAEAISCGLPVISTKTGAIPEWFGKYCHLIDECDYKGLASKIIELSTIGKNRNTYKGEFSNEIIATRTIGEMEKIMQ